LPYTKKILRLYTSALSCGVAGGIIIAGLITISHDWRYIYYIATALIAALTVLVIFTLPETAYNRSFILDSSSADTSTIDASKESFENQVEGASSTGPEIPRKKTYLQSLSVFNGTFSTESLFTMFVRPIGLLVLPPVLWATLVLSITVGFIVAVSSNFAVAFATYYQFKAYQSGLCFFAGIVGSLLGVLSGAHLSDMVADFLTKRNGGIREPEMRLPAMMISLITSPLACILYGVGINNRLHWIVPTIGLGLCKLFCFATSENN
jgi:MFS family permease